MITHQSQVIKALQDENQSLQKKSNANHKVTIKYYKNQKVNSQRKLLLWRSKSETAFLQNSTGVSKTKTQKRKPKT